jgi:hypothetical protein
MSSSISLPVRVRTLFGLLSAGARRGGGLFVGGVCVLDLHVGESVCEGRWCAREKCGWYGELGGVGVVSEDGGAVFEG